MNSITLTLRLVMLVGSAILGVVVLAAVRALRYSATDYFWINDMHPIKPELDGKDLSQIKDPDGKHLSPSRSSRT